VIGRLLGWFGDLFDRIVEWMHEHPIGAEHGPDPDRGKWDHPS